MIASKLGAAIAQMTSGNIEVTEAFFVEKLGFEVGGQIPGIQIPHSAERKRRNPFLAGCRRTHG